MITLIATLGLVFLTIIVRLVKRATRAVVDTGSKAAFTVKDAAQNPKYTAFTVRDSVLSKVYSWQAK